MKTTMIPGLILCGLGLLLGGCGGEEKPAYEEAPDVAEQTPPQRIEVEHILIGVRNPRMADVKRSATAAKALADRLMKQIEDGADFVALKREHSDDRQNGKAGGPYKMANDGVAANRFDNEMPRRGMVPAFGNVGFRLKVGEVGLAPFHPKDSPYGYHLIKRIR